MMRPFAAILAFSLLLPWPSAPARASDYPSVARPRYVVEGNTIGSGTVFFLPAADETGAVAVAAAHNFDLDELAAAGEVHFVLGRSGAQVSVSSRFWAPPGRPFSDDGATLADDYVIFALDRAPQGVEPLRPARDRTDLVGERVQILGVPSAIPQDEDDIFGTVSQADDTRIVVDLDAPVDLRGWGGAPVLRHPEREVIGVLEAAWPDNGVLRLGVAPLDKILHHLLRPLDGGLGRPFAAFAGAQRATAGPPPRDPGPGVWSPPEDRSPTPGASADPVARTYPNLGTRSYPDPANDPVVRTGPRRPSDPAATSPTATDPGAPPEGPERDSAWAVSARRGPILPEPGETLLGEAGDVETRVHVEFDHPADGVILGDESGAFVAGRALAQSGELKRFDVMLVLDTSGSTGQMTGADINGNGVVGMGGISGIFGRSDAGDSVLAAEVAAARRILRSLDARNTRVGLISFAGQDTNPRGGMVIQIGSRRPAVVVEQALTNDFVQIDRALQHLLERGPEGLTNMAEAVDVSYIELFGLRGARSEVDPESEKVVLFFTDGQPTLPYDAMYEADNVRAVLRAADRASKLGLRIHSFAIGPEALAGPVATVEMAQRTGGYFTPVRHPGDLVSVIDNVSLSNIDALSITNTTTGEEASNAELGPDGSFAALVPLEVGRNVIEVRATAEDGSEAIQELVINYAPGAESIELPRELTAARNRLLSERLVELRRERLGIEREQVEQTRKSLQIEIERERAAAQQRAEQQRKALDLEVTRPDAEPLPQAAPDADSSTTSAPRPGDTREASPAQPFAGS